MIICLCMFKTYVLICQAFLTLDEFDYATKAPKEILFLSNLFYYDGTWWRLLQ